MSPKEIGLITAVAFLAVTALAVLFADISSADYGNPDPDADPQCDFTRPLEQQTRAPVQQSQNHGSACGSPIQMMNDPRQGLASPGNMNAGPGASFGPSPVNAVQNLTRNSAYTSPTNADIYNAALDIMGDEAQDVLGADRVSICSSTVTSDTDGCVIDDAFLSDLADELEDSCPDASNMIRSAMDLRSYMLSLLVLQDFETSNASSSGRKTEADEPVDEAEETDVVTVTDDDETETDDEEAPIAPVSVTPNAHYDEAGVTDTAVSVEECRTWAAQGPAL